MLQKRKMGKTDLKLSIIGIGGWQLFEINNEKESLSIIEHAIDKGINFCETASYYGHSELIIAKSLRKSLSKSFIVSTKCGKRKDGKFDISPKNINYSINNSLKIFRKEYLDIFLITIPKFDSITFNIAVEELTKLKKDGKVCFIGASIRDVKDGENIILHNSIDVLEVKYNLFDVRFDTFIKKCFEKKIGIIIKSSLNQGLLTGKYDNNTRFDINDVRNIYLDKTELIFRNNWIENYIKYFNIKRQQLRENAIQFVLSNPFISTVALGCKSVAQLKENIAIANNTPISNDLRKRIVNFSQQNSQGFKWANK